MNKVAFKVFEENLTKICKEKNVSIRKIFKECGIPRSRYYIWKDGENGLDKMDVRDIAYYLGTTYRYLMTDHSIKPLKGNIDVLHEVSKEFGNDARRLLINFIQLSETNKREILHSTMMLANAVYGASGDKRYEDTATSN